MRIVHVIGSVAPRLGGPSKAVLEMSAALARYGHDVDVVTTTLADRGSWLPRKSDRNSGGIVRGRRTMQDGYGITYCASVWPTRWVASPEMVSVLRSLIPRADVVHIHSLYLFPTLVASRLSRARGVPYVVRPHGTLDPNIRRRHSFWKKLYHGMLENSTLANSAAIHFTTPTERDLALPVLPAGVKTYVVPLGVDLRQFNDMPAKQAARRSLGIDPHSAVWVFVGRLHESKGIDLLAAAFVEFCKEVPNARLIIAGPDDDRLGVRLMEECRKAGVAELVRLRGFLEGLQMREVLGAADFWVLPSYSDSFGLAVVEAMAAKVPVLITDRVNISPAVQSMGAGIVVRPDKRSLLDGMLRLAHLSSEERATMGERGRELCATSYSWERTAAELSILYHNVASVCRIPQNA